ncbi:MAG: hypothetical protein J6Q25_01530 [Bacteroidales bacterium]|nr:hypothetical protein [Bacteroidales bacterium]
MRKSIIAVLLLCCYLWTNSENSAQGERQSRTDLEQNQKLYLEYCQHAKSERSWTLSFPKQMVEMSHPDGFQYFTFGPQQLINPIFEYEPLVKLSKHCTIALEFKHALRKTTKPRNKDHALTNLAENPFGDGFLMLNLSRPNELNNPAVIKKKSSEVETYSRVIGKGKAIKLTHCEVISIVEIPQLANIKVHKHRSKREAIVESFQPGFESDNLHCYAVCFQATSAESTPADIRMIFFIDGNKTSIDKCIAKAAKYIKFD